MSASNHDPDVDPVTGYETTGHDWNGIRELNTPIPKVVIWALALTIIYSVISWVLLPAWPLGRDYTRGLLGLDQAEAAESRYREIAAVRDDWLERLAGGDLAALATDAELMARAMPAAERLFADNCAACHGADGTGGPGFPNLADESWLWGGDAATVAETLQVGINSAHPDTRFAQMPAFGRDGMLARDEIAAVTDYVQGLSSGEANPDSTGAALFADNCAACHGDDGSGGLENGAPSLADDAWIYGSDPASLRVTLRDGRQGVMPAWSGRLSPAEINLIALYVARLDEGEEGEGGK